MSVPDLIASFLKISVISSFEVLVEFLLFTPISKADPEYLLCCLCVCKFNRRSAVKLDILGREILSGIEHFTLHVEHLHTKTSRLRNAIIDTGVSCFSAVTHGDGEFSRLGKELCLSKMRRQVTNDELSLDKPLRSRVCP